MQLDTYYLVLLRRGPRADEYTGDTLARLQQAHLDHLARLHARGHALVAGPFDVGPRDPLRGMIIFSGTLAREEVEELVHADPSVRAGRLQVQVLKWYTERDAFRWPGARS
ncbi:MAG: hypothetical protein D6775_14250 [Caldilineae bacterium]|nr:MAG: hypothetical protein D6775_14250 [Caldilineae bacterium]